MTGIETDGRYIKLEEAFRKDGFSITKRVFTESGRMGLEARHNAAVNYDTGEKKKSYYIEGSPYERGFLLGLLAEPEIADMAIIFADNIAFDFLGLDFLNSFAALQDFIVYAIYELSRKAWSSMPRHIHDEMLGMIDGCKTAARHGSRLTASSRSAPGSTCSAR